MLGRRSAVSRRTGIDSSGRGWGGGLSQLLHAGREPSQVRPCHEVAELFGRDGGPDLQMSSDVWSLQHSRHLSLGEQIDLQIEMPALVRLPGELVLAAEDEEARKMTASSETVIVRKGNGKATA
jgi:hypothetical protein